ncbi:MAG: TRAP transporter small permease subunit, partial [Acidisphaera sp.]|nr:TRAP transporter small permease subunit [Acidisphaera sp.]
MDSTVRPAARASGRAAAGIERGLQLAVEAACAALVLAEIGILFAGVLSRFVFRHPLVWTDELASILFLWLAMLGAVVALLRGQHMRLTALAAGGGPAWRGCAEALAVGVPALFLLIL